MMNGELVTNQESITTAFMRNVQANAARIVAGVVGATAGYALGPL